MLGSTGRHDGFVEPFERLRANRRAWRAERRLSYAQSGLTHPVPGPLKSVTNAISARLRLIT
jgi:hypothetical protein